MKASTIDRLLFLLLPLVVLCVAEAGLAQERCSTCHPASRVEFEQSVHAREEVSCTSCHGGDPDSLDTESAHRGRFSP